MAMLDMGDTGVIGFDDFVEFAEGGLATGQSDDDDSDSGSDSGGGRRSSSRKRRRRAGGTGDDGGDVDDLADELRRLVQKAKKRGVDYRTSFEHFDRDYSGEIDRSEFKKGLRKLDFDLSDSDARRLMERFEGRRGHIKYRDFLRFVAPRHEATVEEVAQKLRKMINRIDTRKAFKHFERNSKGKITRMKFKRGLERLEFDLTDSEVRMLMDKFDENGDGVISYDEFRDFADGVESGRSGRKKKRRSSIDDDLEDEFDDASGDDGRVSKEGAMRSVRDAEKVIVAVERLKLSQAARGDRKLQKVSVEYKFLESRKHCTEAARVDRDRGSASFDYTVTFPVRRNKGSGEKRLRSKLKRMLDSRRGSGKGDISFAVMAERKGSSRRGRLLGQATCSLHDILEDGRDLVEKKLEVVDPDTDRRVGDLIVSVTADKALQQLMYR